MLCRFAQPGVKTHRDHFALDFDSQTLIDRISNFRDLNFSDEEISEKYNLHMTRDWKLSQRRIMLAEDVDWENHFTQFHCSFDFRPYYNSENVVELPRLEVMNNLFEKNNLGLIANRQIRDNDIRHAWVSREIVDFHVLQTAECICLSFPFIHKK